MRSTTTGVSVSLELGDLGSAGGYLAQASSNMDSEAIRTAREINRLKAIKGSFALRQGRIDDARADLDSAIAADKNVYWRMRALLIRAEVNLTDNDLVAAEADAKLGLSLTQSAQGTTLYSNRTGLAWRMLGRARQARRLDGRLRGVSRRGREFGEHGGC